MNANIHTISELKEKVEKYAADCSDAYTESKRLQFNTHGCMIYKTRESSFTVNMAGNPNEHAMSQIIEKLDAPPAAWLLNEKRCNLTLRAKVLNNLAVDRPNSGLFIRHKGDNVRAVLSSQYTKFDNTKFVDMIGKAVEHIGAEVRVHRAEVGDQLSAYILIPSITFDRDPSNPNGNGGLHPAIYTSNSETGTGSARITGGLYRTVCSNGAIYGWKSDEALAVRHRYLTAYAMQSIVASGIAAAMHMSETAAEAYVAANEIPIEETSIKGIISEWANKYGLTISAKENWLKCVTQEVDNQDHEQPMLIDVFNAATFSAHSITNVQEREMVERMAGDMLQAYTRR